MTEKMQVRQDMFLLACFRDNVGSNVSFHAVDACGYVTDVSLAHQYTFNEAQRAWNLGREFDQPISLAEIEKYVTCKVDCQKLPCDSVKGEPGDKYYAFVARKWDGNDVYWLVSPNDTQGHTSIDAAHVFAENELRFNSKVVYLPVHMVDRFKRKTFSYAQYNPRKMVQAYGLRVPERIKAERRRARSRRHGTGKTRMNCPRCGKINWQYNPYDFERCQDIECEASKDHSAYW